jgi:hypothetical protein
MAIAVLSSCASDVSRAPAPDVMTVSGVDQKFAALEGQTIRIRGWMGRCTNEQCGLFASRSEARKGVITGWAHVLTPDASFLAQQVDQQVREVILQARVVVTCRSGEVSGIDGPAICLERIGYLVPVSAQQIGR